MIKLRTKIIISIIMIFVLGIITMQMSVYAANENVAIVQKNANEYIIYIKDNMNNDFEFALSNNKNELENNLIFRKAGTDSTDNNSNKIAYVNSTTIDLFKNPTYIWVKDKESNYISEGIQIDLNDSINEQKLNDISNITKTIKIDIEQSTTSQKDETGKTITTTIGKVILPETSGNYEYSLIKVSESEEYSKLMNLATKISKFNSKTDMYTKVNVYKQINSLISKLTPENFIKLDGNEIEQPKEALNDEEYILWVNEKNGNQLKQDIQFLTSYREESKETIIEKITTKLPVTYDNNVLLVLLSILIVITALVYIRIKILNKKENRIK